jgi:putative flippase GtrA
MADLRALARRASSRVFTRYAIGSVVAGVITEATLLVTYGLGLLGPYASSVLAWAFGAVVNYIMTRHWAWRRRGAPRPVRELLPYWLAAVASLIISSWATGVAHEWGERFFATEGPRVVFVGTVFLGVYGVLFIAKFYFFNYFVFADTRSERAGAAGAGEVVEEDEERRRSRSQVPITTRE